MFSKKLRDDDFVRYDGGESDDETPSEGEIQRCPKKEFQKDARECTDIQMTLVWLSFLTSLVFIVLWGI